MKAKLIINPEAGRLPTIAEWTFKRFKALSKNMKTVEEIIEAVTKECEQANIKLDIEFTKYPKHAMRIAKDAKNRYDMVIAAGGDGTINEVVNGIANSKTSLAVIPFGTCNVLASELGIPLNIKEASELIANGKKIKIDLGYAEMKNESRYYSMVLSVGFDAHVIKNTTSEFRKRWGMTAYMLSGLGHLIRYKWKKFYVKHKSISKCYFVIVANSKFTGCEYPMADSASMTDGFLDLIIINKNSWWNIIKLLFNLSTGRLNKSLQKEYYKIKEAYIYGAHGTPVQVDGELIGKTPVKVRILPKALNVIVKKGWQAESRRSCP